MNRKRTYWLVAGLLLFAGAGLLGHHFFFTAYAVPIDKYNQVVGGMTENQVREIMGQPDSIRHYTADTTAFFYGGWLSFKWCSMEVYFNSNQLVTGKFHDD